MRTKKAASSQTYMYRPSALVGSWCRRSLYRTRPSSSLQRRII